MKKIKYEMLYGKTQISRSIYVKNTFGVEVQDDIRETLAESFDDFIACLEKCGIRRSAVRIIAEYDATPEEVEEYEATAKYFEDFGTASE